MIEVLFRVKETDQISCQVCRFQEWTDHWAFVRNKYFCSDAKDVSKSVLVCQGRSHFISLP